ncbi:gp75 [Mycobacterium phage Omega]|uniref:Uncharacterized protein n=1 Tax=Mycobacterium phage Omega TaxID=2907835 RepID=Q854I9_BPMOM|nr:gp75 [Mycobacterium phage Omega]AAN12719.1 hypothetical protein PBI_OMEGA_75 [Mycobacterium phage Omega]QPO16672.1 hypothetical protein SEA_KASHFLOW_64 [Mycobacterium phage KashFlow]
MPDLNPDQVSDLINRMEDAIVKLNFMADEKRVKFPHGTDFDRLRGKAEGVRLALSYLREYVR